MLSKVLSRWSGGDLTGDEKRLACDAIKRTLRLLYDALKKKGSLLVDNVKKFRNRKMKIKYRLLITTDLVKDLIRVLEKVTFAKNTNPVQDIKTIAYVYPECEDRTIYLCAEFWKMDPTSRSKQRAIIHEVSHFLGYGHTIQENSDIVQRSPQSMLCPLTCYSVASALTSDMDHPEPYRDGSYSCCGETSRHTVCEESWMADKLRSSRTGEVEDGDYKAPNVCSLFPKKLKKDMINDVDILIVCFLLLERLDCMTDLLMMKTNLLGTDLKLPGLDKEAKHKEH